MTHISAEGFANMYGVHVSFMRDLAITVLQLADEFQLLYTQTLDEYVELTT